MLFNNIDKNTKLEILEENIPEYEKDVYSLLVKLGINPTTFNENTYEQNDPSVDVNDLTTLDLRKRLKAAVDVLDSINQEIANLEG
jgi:signal-transduction protein with cAMP-binding, CBS, and nucleotidyltransferase domain